MGKFKVQCEDKSWFNFELIDKLLSETYSQLGQAEDLVIELIMVDNEDIQVLNRETRGVDRVTDVLSYPSLNLKPITVVSREQFSNDYIENEGVFLGSVVLCLERAKEQAEEYGHSLEREVIFLILHGILHTFGFDHEVEEDEEQMMSVADKIMKKLSIIR